MTITVILKTEEHRSTVLQLSQEFHRYRVEDILCVSKTVFDDAYYDVEIESDEEIRYANVYVNGIGIGHYSDHQFHFDRMDSRESMLFRGQLGYAWVSIEVFGETTEPNWFYSEYASILIKTSRKGKAIEEMLRYIYENQAEILLEKSEVAATDSFDREASSDLWSRIVLIEDIINTYEACYGYFKSNSRCKLISYDVVDKVEKLQSIDARTINYMVSHPDLLKQESSGIRFGGNRYLPQKTLMQQKHMSQDIYENQVVKSFLNSVFEEICKLKDKIENYLKLISNNEENGNYIVSSALFYESAKETLSEYHQRIASASKRLIQLQGLYRGALNVMDIDCPDQPKPTMVFTTIPQYNRIYMCMARWFGYRGFDFTKELVMMSFIDAPSVYEYYVLVKLVNQIKLFGYQLVEAKWVNYPMQEKSRHVVKEFCNTFVYQGEDSQLTIYYEPVIYDEDSRHINGISLYRNNTVSFRTGEERKEGKEGHYYVPDYIFKIERNGTAKYVICDAKYSVEDKVRVSIMPELSYRYLISLSTVEEGESVAGLVIFYGLPERDAVRSSFYNRAIGNVVPFIEICPLTESQMTWQQENNLLQIIQMVIKNS